MLVFDFFSGTGSSTQAFRDAGHTVITFELDPEFLATENIDVFLLNAKDLISKYGQPDFVWASPPCTAFSVASIGHHWLQGGENPIPKTEAARVSQDLVQHTISLIEQLEPKYGYLIENPRGMLRKLPVVKNLNRYTITYCQYGDTRMKPTDVWGTIEGWTPRPMCAPGRDCHESSPAGTNAGGTGKLRNARLRSMIPYELGEEICKLIERHAV